MIIVSSSSYFLIFDHPIMGFIIVKNIIIISFLFYFLCMVQEKLDLHQVYTMVFLHIIFWKFTIIWIWNFFINKCCNSWIFFTSCIKSVLNKYWQIYDSVISIPVWRRYLLYQFNTYILSVKVITV